MLPDKKPDLSIDEWMTANSELGHKRLHALGVITQRWNRADPTFIETQFGKGHSTKGLGNWFADRCIEAEVRGRAHGFRKAGATVAAENGATPYQLMSIFGWKTLAQAEL